MTNEEAIEVFKNDIEICTIQQKQACDMAIKAIDQQPAEDCVSRTDVLKVMCEKCPVYDCITGCQSYRSIEKMPSVTPKPYKAESEE